MDSMFFDPILNKVDSTESVWVSIAEDTSASAENIGRVADILEMLQQGWKGTTAELKRLTDGLTISQREVVKLVSDGVVKANSATMNTIIQSLKSVSSTAADAKKNGEFTDRGLQQALRSTIVPVLKKQLGALGDREIGKLAEALGDPKRSAKSNEQNRVAAGYRELYSLITGNKKWQRLVEKGDPEAQRLTAELQKLINTIRADEIRASGGAGSAKVNAAFRELFDYAQKQKISFTSQNIGNVGRATNQAIANIKGRITDVDKILKQSQIKKADKEVEAQLKATVENLKKQGVDYELRRRGGEIEVIVYDPSALNTTNKGKNVESRLPKMTFAVGGYRDRASHQVYYEGELVPAGVAQARMNKKLSEDRIFSIPSLSQKISELNAKTEYRVKTKFDRQLTVNPAQEADKKLNEATIRYEMFQEELEQMEKALHPKAFERDITTAVGQLFQAAIGNSMDEIASQLEMIRSKYGLAEETVEHFKKHGRWLEKTQQMSEEDLKHSRVYLKEAVADKMFLSTRKIQNRDILKYAEGGQDKLVQNVQIDVGRVMQALEKSKLDSKKKARYKSLLEGMPLGTVLMLENEMEQLNSVREGVAVKVTQEEYKKIQKELSEKNAKSGKSGKVSKKEIYAELMRRSGREAFERGQVSGELRDGMYILRGDELVRVGYGNKLNAEGTNLRAVTQGMDEDFLNWILELTGIQRNDSARAIAISALDTDAKGRNLGPFVTGIIRDAINTFSPEQFKEEIKKGIDGNRIKNGMIDGLAELAIEIFNNPGKLEELITKKAGDKASSLDKSKILGQVLFAFATAGGRNSDNNRGIFINEEGLLRLGDKAYGLSFIDRVGVRETEYAASGNAKLATNFEFNDLARSFRRAGVKLEHFSDEELEVLMMRAIGASDEDIEERQKAYRRYQEHLGRQQAMISKGGEPNYLLKTLTDDTIVVGDRDLYKGKVNENRLIDIMGLQTSDMNAAGEVGNRGATIWGKLEEILKDKDLDKTRIVVDLGEDMGNLRYLDLNPTTKQYGGYNNKIETLLASVTAGYNATAKKNLLTEAMLSEIFAFDNTKGALNANFLQKALENKEENRKRLEKDIGKKLLDTSFYGGNINVTKLDTAEEVPELAKEMAKKGVYVSRGRIEAMVAEGLGSMGGWNTVEGTINNLVTYLQKFGGDEARLKEIFDKGNPDRIIPKSLKDAIELVTSILTVGEESHKLFYGGTKEVSPLLTHGLEAMINREPYSQMVNMQFGNYVFGKNNLGDNVIETNTGLGALIQADFDGDKLLTVLLDIQRTAEENGSYTKEQKEELKNGIKKLTDFNNYNYEVMSANIKAAKPDDSEFTVLFNSKETPFSTEEQRQIIFAYQNRSKSKTGYLSNLAKGARNYLDVMGYGSGALIGSSPDASLKYAQGSVVFQMLEQMEQDAISAKKLWDVAIEEMKAVAGENLPNMTENQKAQIFQKYFDNRLMQVIDQVYSGRGDLLSMEEIGDKEGIFKEGKLSLQRSLEILTPISNQESAKDILENLFKGQTEELNNIAKIVYPGKEWKDIGDKEEFQKELRKALMEGRFSEWGLSTKAMGKIIKDFNKNNPDFLARAKLYTGRFQEEFGPSKALADADLPLTAAAKLLKTVESFANKEKGSDDGTGGEGAKDIVSVLTEIRDLLMKQGRGDLNDRFGKKYMAVTSLANMVVGNKFKESSSEFIRKRLQEVLGQGGWENWDREQRAKEFGFKNVEEFEKERGLLVGSLQGTYAHALDEIEKKKNSSKEEKERASEEAAGNLKSSLRALGYTEEQTRGYLGLSEVAAVANSALMAKIGGEGSVDLGSEIAFANFKGGNNLTFGGIIDALKKDAEGYLHVIDFKNAKSVGIKEMIQAVVYTKFLEELRQKIRDRKALDNLGELQKIAEEYKSSYGQSITLDHLKEIGSAKGVKNPYLIQHTEGKSFLWTLGAETPMNILLKIASGETLTPDEEKIFKGNIQLQTPYTTEGDKKKFLDSYRLAHGEAYGTSEYVDASKELVSKQKEALSLRDEITKIQNQRGEKSPLVQKLTDYYNYLLVEISGLEAARQKLVEEYEWALKDQDRADKQAEEKYADEVASSKFGYLGLITEDEKEREASKKKLKQYNDQIAKAEKRMLELDKQSRTTVGHMGPYQESTQTLIEQEKQKIELLIKERQELIENSNLIESEVQSYDQQLATQRLINREEVKRKNKGANNWLDMIGSGIKTTITRMFDYNGVYRILNKLTQTLQKVISLSKELDTATFNIQVVTGQTREETSGLITEYRKLGDELGATTIQIANAANEWLN